MPHRLGTVRHPAEPDVVLGRTREESPSRPSSPQPASTGLEMRRADPTRVSGLLGMTPSVRRGARGRGREGTPLKKATRRDPRRLQAAVLLVDFPRLAPRRPLCPAESTVGRRSLLPDEHSIAPQYLTAAVSLSSFDRRILRAESNLGSRSQLSTCLVLSTPETPRRCSRACCCVRCFVG